ncbi:MAG: Protein-glutamine gamma-glutamyltransferase [Alphaproteobacteria bacterium ADurb.BinA280]|jgi:transglutaminase-like putative cysteine protease|nr:MAG: Protein-glutamine gamma-glutamyltransferase [Alphaproteobacteria bacterium ADurb.BinA280]
MKARTAQINREAFVWCASAALAALLPLGLLLPFWVSVLLGSLAMIGTFAGWRGLRIPAWLRLLLTLSTAGLVLFAFGFRIGRDTGAGLLATMLALKLLETHQLRDARSLVSFSLFGLMAAFLQDQGPITLLLAVIATLIALAALMHVHQLELPDPTAMPVSRTQHLRAVLNLAALSIPLALVGFLLFPRLASPLWGLPNNSAARTGLSETMAPGDMTQLLSDDSPALRVQFFTPPPNPAQMFWRGPVLSQFDGRQWNLFRGLREIESGTLLEDGALVDYELTQEPTDRRLILSLDVAQAAPAGTDPGEIKLGWDRSLHSRKPLSQISQYRLRSAVQYRFEPELRATMRNWMLQLPQQTNPRTWIEVQQWRSDGLDDVAIIQRALNWFNREFFYTLAPRPLGQNSVDEFLFDSKEGYCEHYASAFTVMMRMAGIPARVVTGYQGGEYNPLGDYWLVRQSDAHAWSEVWIANRGWVRIDPTAAVAAERIRDGGRESSDSRDSAVTWWQSTLHVTDWMRRNWNDLVLGFNAAKQQQMLGWLGFTETGLSQMLIVLGIATLLALLATFVLLLRSQRRSRSALSLALDRFARRLRIAHPVGDTELQLAQRAAARYPADAKTIYSLIEPVLHIRYATLDKADTPAPAEERRVIRALRNFRVRQP